VSGGSAEPTPRAARSDPPRVWTVLELLRWTTQHFASRGIETARLDAECLLAAALGVERLQLYLDFDKPVTPAERGVFRELVRRRAGERVPVSQLLGRREFWSLSLRTTADVLTPRPETETVVSAALAWIPEGRSRVLDLGTGSGALALAIAVERPEAVITATDISQEALKVAQENAERYGMVQRIRFLRGHWLEPVVGETFDWVVSNPPYLADPERAGLPPELTHEPERALFAGVDGLDALRQIVAGVGAVLAPGGGLVVEIAPRQEAAVLALCRAAGLEPQRAQRDLAGRPRAIAARARAAVAG
jgi:release factor glutamine methyltransferase